VDTGVNDLLTGFWFSKRSHHGRHHLAPGVALQFTPASSEGRGSGKYTAGPSIDYE
jgi:hypothetical protein